ncbi:MAG: hypothetical protein V7641_5042 [Blastocatellia bacterium]
MTAAVYESSPIKRKRRGFDAIATVRDALYDVLSAEHPMTVRQVFYRLVSAGAIEKTEAEYKSTVCRLLGRMRREGVVPFGWIADSTRWMRKPCTFSTLESALELTAQTYRRAMWDNQPVYVEVWLEKDALAGVLMDETEKWDVPLMVTRGYPSLSYLYSAAEQITAIEKPAYLYYFGDYDPSGVDITRAVESGIREFAPDAEIYFERVAVTPAQIRQYGLLTRPTKKTDSRSKNFEGESVEVDAIPPAMLRQMARECIEQHIDEDALERLHLAEQSERESMQIIADAWRDGRLRYVPEEIGES